MTLFGIVEIIVVILSVVGSVLIARKKRAGLAIWVVADILSVPLFLDKGLAYMTALYVFFACTSTYGFWYWSKKEKHYIIVSDGWPMSWSEADKQLCFVTRRFPLRIVTHKAAMKQIQDTEKNRKSWGLSKSQYKLIPAETEEK